MNIHNEYAAMHAMPLQIKTQAQLRDSLQTLLYELYRADSNAGVADSGIDREDLEQLTLGCHKKLRALQNLIACKQTRLPEEAFDAAELLEELCRACDFALSGSGRHVWFYSEAESLPVRGFPRSISNAVLNLIANACQHGTGSEVLLRLRENAAYGGGAMGGGALLEVINAGALDCAALARGAARRGSGLRAVRTAALANGGRLLFHSRAGFVHAVLHLPPTEKSAQLSPCPDFVELLCDRLSPVYIGLAGICEIRC